MQYLLRVRRIFDALFLRFRRLVRKLKPHTVLRIMIVFIFLFVASTILLFATGLNEQVQTLFTRATEEGITAQECRDVYGGDVVPILDTDTVTVCLYNDENGSSQRIPIIAQSGDAPAPDFGDDDQPEGTPDPDPTTSTPENPGTCEQGELIDIGDGGLFRANSCNTACECSEGDCHPSAGCAETFGDSENASKYWCFGFEGGARCLVENGYTAPSDDEDPPPETDPEPAPGGDASEFDCRDDPAGEPEEGFTWKALCEQQCFNDDPDVNGTDNSLCPLGFNDQEGWCYAFEQGNPESARCLQFQEDDGGDTPPETDPDPAPVNDPPASQCQNPTETPSDIEEEGWESTGQACEVIGNSEDSNDYRNSQCDGPEGQRWCYSQCCFVLSDTPPAEDPPAEDPSADDPPAENPPAENPPEEDPPAEDPPAENPPEEDPPEENPPAEDPPAEDPPPGSVGQACQDGDGLESNAQAFCNVDCGGFASSDPESETYREGQEFCRDELQASTEDDSLERYQCVGFADCDGSEECYYDRCIYYSDSDNEPELPTDSDSGDSNPPGDPSGNANNNQCESFATRSIPAMEPSEFTVFSCAERNECTPCRASDSDPGNAPLCHPSTECAGKFNDTNDNDSKYWCYGFEPEEGEDNGFRCLVQDGYDVPTSPSTSNPGGPADEPEEPAEPEPVDDDVLDNPAPELPDLPPDTSGVSWEIDNDDYYLVIEVGANSVAVLSYRIEFQLNFSNPSNQTPRQLLEEVQLLPDNNRTSTNLNIQPEGRTEQDIVMFGLNESTGKITMTAVFENPIETRHRILLGNVNNLGSLVNSLQWGSVQIGETIIGDSNKIGYD